jgi:DNA-binding CsgD family transcriptional regulator
VSAFGLLERDQQLAELGAYVEEAHGGRGALVVLEAPAGVGKTALLSAACERARGAGATVLEAVGDELEHELAFGVARQLLAGTVRDNPELLEGPAELAGPVLGFPGREPAAGGDALGAAMHGLHWLCVGLSEVRPLVLAIDDAHWADPASLRFLAYLARRIEPLPALAVVSTRTGEPERRAVESLNPPQGVHRISLAPLSADASTTLLRSLLPEVGDYFCAACHEATGGNPFLIRELCRALVADGVDPALASPADLEGLSLEDVARAVLARAAGLPAPAGELAQAIALFPGGAEPRHAAKVAGVDPETAATAADALIAQGVLEPGAPPLRFLHPLIRTAIYADMPSGRRAVAHARAAETLLEEGVQPEQIATHVLASQPEGRAVFADVLARAGSDALEIGAPDAAIRYLRRALDEPPPAETRPGLTHALGIAELTAGAPQAVERLADAVEATPDPETRARMAIDLARAMGLAGRALDGVAALDEAVEATRDPQLRLELEAEAQWLLWQIPQGIEAYRSRLDKLPDDLPGDTLAEQIILCYKANEALVQLSSADRVRELGRRAIAGTRLVDGGLQAGAPSSFAITALALVDELDAARQFVDELIRSYRQAGILVGLPMIHADAAELALFAGDVRRAEQEALESLVVLDGQPPMHPAWRWARGCLVGALLEQQRLDEAAGIAPDDEWPFVDAFAVMECAWRGRLRAARGQVAEATADLDRVAEWAKSHGLRDPGGDLVFWRGDLALLRQREGRIEEALELTDGLLADARRIGADGMVGDALRFAALVREGEERGEMLSSAVEYLARSPRRLVHGKALVDLGESLRRLGHRADARAPLREGMEIARRCGAAGLQRRALDELRASGGRLRTPALRGIDALTPSEQRVAQLAARGLTNRQIGEELWLARSTVEMHLRNTYRKLEIRSRTELAEALKR